VGKLSQFIQQVLGFDGWKVKDWWYENSQGVWFKPVSRMLVPANAPLVVVVGRMWMGRCAKCGRRCQRLKEQQESRNWRDLPWCEHPVSIIYAPKRLKCKHCKEDCVELLPWADPYQRQTKRFQQHIAIETASMPVSHVAAIHGISWNTVRRAEQHALERWQATRKAAPLTMVGIDEKYLGRRNAREDKYVTIVSNLDNGEPIWIGPGRAKDTVCTWIDTLSPEQKAQIRIFVMDMHAPFMAAIRSDEILAKVPIAHDPFHIVKLANNYIDELRRDVFFRAGPLLRGIGRGKRWLFLRAWDNCTPEQQKELKRLLALNSQLANAYQIVEELRAVLHAPDEETMLRGLKHILRRTQNRKNLAMRKLHESLKRHMPEILALGRYRPPAGRVESLNNNWETLVRQGRGYRDLDYLLLKLRFAIVNPIREANGILRFQALGRPAPYREAA
jgi:transposase